MRRLCLVVGMLLVLAPGCGSKRSEEASETTGNRGELATEKRQALQPFVIREAGIRFRPPSSWDPALIQMEAKAGSDADAQQPGAEYWVTFDYQAEQPAHPDHPLLRLMVFPRAVWTRLVAEPGPSPGAPIDSVDAWMFVAALPSSNPYREGSLDADQFGAMVPSLAAVREGFSIEGDGPREAPGFGTVKAKRS